MALTAPILTLDAAGSYLSLELGQCSVDGCYLSLYKQKLGENKLHEILLRSIDTFFQNIDMAPEYLGGIAINLGPGNYSRLRISLTWAKTAAYYLKIPLIGYDSFTIADTYLKRISQINQNQAQENIRGIRDVSDGVASFIQIPNLDDRKIQLSNYLLDKIPSFLSSFKIYLYRVSHNRLFACTYWHGKRIGRVIPLTTFPPSPLSLSIDSFLKFFNIADYTSSMMEIYEDIIKQIKMKKKFYFLLDGTLNESNGDDHSFSSKEKKELDTVLILNKLEREINKAIENFPGISIYHCVIEDTFKKKPLNGFFSDPLLVNPKYYRDFGE